MNFNLIIPFRVSVFGNTFIETIFGSVFVQFTRVEICGVNTAKLKVLKEAEKMALLKKIRETGDEKARQDLVEGNLRLVLLRAHVPLVNDDAEKVVHGGKELGGEVLKAIGAMKDRHIVG